MIPKIIHYCWLSDDPVPEIFQKYIDGWKTKLKGYEFCKWDFSRFDKKSSLWVAEAFDNKKYAFAADYIRLYAVYNQGGIYMDMDIEVLKSFDDLLDKPYMFAVERPNESWIEAGCFGAEKGNAFIKDCLLRYQNRHFIKEDGTFDQLPLPQVMDRVRRKKGYKFDLYPWYFFTAKSYDTGEESPTDETYAIHHFAGSWKSQEEKKEITLARKLSKVFGVNVGHKLARICGVYKKMGLTETLKYCIRKIRKRMVHKDRKGSLK